MKRSFICSAKEFGFGFTLKLFLNQAKFKLTHKKKFLAKKHKLILHYLDKNYGNLLKDSTSKEKIIKDSKVWIFWWQGIDENTPKLVKACIESVKKNFTENEVVIVTKENFKQYVNIPNYILEKVENKEISLTHFSDILRVSLIYEHGGIWLDSTIFETSPIIDDITKYSFYSNKLPLNSVGEEFVSRGQWSAFFLAGNKGEAIFGNLQKLFFEYWKTHHNLIAYLFIDYSIKLMYDKFAKIREKIDSVPINNENIYGLAKEMFNVFNKEKFSELANTSKIFKLTYKFSEEQSKLNNTLYKYLIGEENNEK